MLIAGIVLLGLVLTSGAAALWSAVKKAPEGYEDETGFHVKEPAPQAVTIRRETKPANHAAHSAV